MTKNKKLGELINEYGGLIKTGPFGSQLHQSDYSDNGIPVVMPKDIRDGHIDEKNIARIPEAKAQQLSRHLLKTDSIVLPRRGEISKRAYINGHQTGYLCGTGCVKIELPDKILYPRFFYYYLGLKEVIEWLERNAIGTTMLNLNTKIISEIQIPDIPLKNQERISDILTTYDTLIENNRRRIQLLEQAARMLYKEWFVHLRFPGHEHVKIVDGVPEGWEKKTIGEVTPFKYGKSLKKDNRIQGPIPVYGSSGVVGTHDKALAQGPGIIVGRKGNVGSVFWSSSDFCPIDTVFYVENKHSSLFNYFALQNTAFISTDVAVPGLNRYFAHSRPIIIPNTGILKAFEEFNKPIYKQISILQKHIGELIKARDLLLPRLMNGEITV